jgi:cytochrome b
MNRLFSELIAYLQNHNPLGGPVTWAIIDALAHLGSPGVIQETTTRATS